MAERRQELHFPAPLTHSCQFAISHSASGQKNLSSLLPADRELTQRSPTHEAFGAAGKGSPASHFFTSADLIMLPIFILLCCTLIILFSRTIFILNCVERGLVPPAWKCGHALDAEKLISLFLSQVD